MHEVLAFLQRFVTQENIFYSSSFILCIRLSSSGPSFCDIYRVSFIEVTLLSLLGFMYIWNNCFNISNEN